MRQSKEPRQKKREYKKLAAREPETTVLADDALSAEEAYRDSFNLRYRLGPVYDILRYPGTHTPMAIAVYGSWGTGKTTAMRWLHGLIDEWNENGSAKTKIEIRPVWFYPWKYDKKDEVWRGLVGEVILNAIDVRRASVKTVTEALKMLAMFVGESAVGILSAAKLGAPGFELGGMPIGEITENFKELAHPEKIYLNPFESSLKTWVAKSLGQNQRMVIFIDDLDRCMPDIALQVLEALKLYLNIENLIFVIGVDKEVINRLVARHYRRLGLDESRSGNYLAKMFHVEVAVEPSEQQMSDFLSEQLEEIPFWTDPQVPDDYKELFRALISKLAKRNPREVKRLINGAIMAGAGVAMMKSFDDRSPDHTEFGQGLQLFFLRKILYDRFQMASEASSRRGVGFFEKWSQIIRAGGEKGRNPPYAIRVPKDFAERKSQDISERGLDMRHRERSPESEEGGMDLSFAPREYHSLLQNPRFSGLLHLLGDADLGRLMQIPYSAEVAKLSAIAHEVSDADIVRRAVASRLGKKPEDLTNEDYSNIKVLDLSDSDLSDVTSLVELRGLQRLSLHGTEIADIEPLMELGSLQWLEIGDTQVADIGVTEQLKDLVGLGVCRAPISDLEQIWQLTNLEVLSLAGIQVPDLEPLKRFSKLRWLSLNHTRVADLEPLEGLKSLQALYLKGTQVADIEPLKGLVLLKELSLSNTKIREINPLRGLNSLQRLYFRGTQVADIEPLRELYRLQELYLSGTQVADIEPLRGLLLLKELSLANTKIREIKPIWELSSLRLLNLYGTQISSLVPITELTSLQELYLSGTQVVGIEPLKGLIKLQVLDLEATQVIDLEPLRGLSSLRELRLKGTPVSDEQVARLQGALPKLAITQ